jgi:hypothetical protein
MRLKTRYIIAFAAILFLWIGSALVKEILWRNKAAECLHRAKTLGLVCKLYARDHEGHFPKTLEDVVPRYLTARYVFVCPFYPDVKMGYEYFGGTDTDNAANVLIQSKMTFHGGHRTVVCVDCSGGIAIEPEARKE